MAAAYALDTLDHPERMACTHHLAQATPHQGCYAAVDEARRVTELLALAVAPAQPAPAHLWRAIEARVSRAARGNGRRHPLRTPVSARAGGRAKVKQHAHR